MKYKLLILTSILIIFKVNAQITFQDHTIIDDTYSTDGALSVYSVDIDGDGDMDVLSASYEDDKIVWYENIDGQGTFGQQQIITNNANGAREVYAIDIDGDGDMDVISASHYTNIEHKVAWYENTDGQGTFGNEQIITTNALGALSVFATDIDGDGANDVISASSYDSKIAWYKNIDGNGNFGAEQIIAINLEQAFAVYATDVDGDGDMDVLASNYQFDIRIVWYENMDGQGNFGPEQLLGKAQTGSTIFAADLDNDNDMDIVCSSSASGNSAWYENIDGLGNFSVAQIISTDPYATSSITAIDFDGDNDVDIVSGYSDGFYNGGQIVWYENIDGLGSFSSEKIVTDISDSSDIFVVDINNDNKVDLVCTSAIDDEVSWYQNLDNQGDFSLELPISVNTNSPRSVYAADIDGDGDKDVLSASYDDDKIAWYENIDGLGNFGQQKIITTSAVYAGSVYAADIDGDGDMDVISASAVDSKVAWYQNIDGQGTFGPQRIISIDFTGTINGGSSVFATDIDGDGDIDVLAGFETGGENNYWFENVDGLGNFIPRAISIYRYQVVSIYAADMDGDNDMDIIIHNDDNAFRLCWFENIDGNGTFNDDWNFIADPNGAKGIYVEDIDNDGDMDVLSASFTDNKIAWHENIDGLGSFESHIISDSEINPNSVYAIDIDNDGDLDVLSTSSYNNTVAWHENIDGLGTFGNEQIITSNTIGIRSVFAADINSDGKNDVLSASEFDNKIAWYENTSTLSIDKYAMGDFSIYPNPTADILYIKTPNYSIEKIELYDIAGKQLKEFDGNEINLTNFKIGIYLLKIFTSSNTVLNSKVIKK